MHSQALHRGCAAPEPVIAGDCPAAGEASAVEAIRRADSLKRSLDEEAAKGAREQAKRQRIEQDVKVSCSCSCTCYLPYQLCAALAGSALHGRAAVVHLLDVGPARCGSPSAQTCKHTGHLMFVHVCTEDHACR